MMPMLLDGLSCLELQDEQLVIVTGLFAITQDSCSRKSPKMMGRRQAGQRRLPDEPVCGVPLPRDQQPR